MKHPRVRESYEGHLFLAGELVPPGVYRQIGSDRQVVLETEDYLPASLDGRIACYEPIEHIWCVVQEQRKRKKKTSAPHPDAFHDARRKGDEHVNED